MLGGMLFAVAFFYFVFGFAALIIFGGYFQMADGPILWFIVLAAPALLIGLIVVRSLSKGDSAFQKLTDAYTGEERSLHKDAAELQLSAEHTLIVPGHESIILDFNKRKIAFPSKSLKVFQPEDLITVELLTDRDLASRVGAIQAAKNAAIGGLLFGGAGAILGALASSKGDLTKVSHVGLRFAFKSPAYTTIDSIIYDGPPVSLSEIQNRITNADLFLAKVRHWKQT